MMAAPPVKVPGGDKAPKDKVRAFNWKKLPNPKVVGTFFDKLGEDLSVPGLKLNYDDLESKFAMKAPVAKAEGEEKKEKKPTVVTFIDPKTAQNLNIWVSKYKKLGNEAIAKAAQNLDSSVFDQAAVNALLGFVPSDEDVTQVCSALCLASPTADDARFPQDPRALGRRQRLRLARPRGAVRMGH